MIGFYTGKKYSLSKKLPPRRLNRSIEKPNYIVSLSGGKDSTAMLHMMIENKELIHSVVFFDTGWEFPQMYDHINLVEKKTGLKIWHLHPQLPFEYWLAYRPVKKGKGINKGKIHRIGYGWPSMNYRWCTSQKRDGLNRYSMPIQNHIWCIGFAYDENRRISNKYRYPLIEYKVTEKEALKYCYDLGYHWDGLYKIFNRVSCYCCPLKSLIDIKNLRLYYPELWKQMLQMDKNIPSVSNNYGFHSKKTVNDLEKYFQRLDSMSLFKNN